MQLNKPNFSKALQVLQNSHVPLKTIRKESKYKIVPWILAATRL